MRTKRTTASKINLDLVFEDISEREAREGLRQRNRGVINRMMLAEDEKNGVIMVFASEK